MATRSKRRQRAEQLDWIVERVTADPPVSYPSNNAPVAMDEMGEQMRQIARLLEHRSKPDRILEIATTSPPLLLQWALERRRRYTLLCGWSTMSVIASRHPHVLVYAGSLAAFAAGHESAFDWVVCSEHSKDMAGQSLERLGWLGGMLAPAGLLTHRETFRPPALSWFRYREWLETASLPPLHRLSLGDGSCLVTCQRRASARPAETRSKKRESPRKAA